MGLNTSFILIEKTPAILASAVDFKLGSQHPQYCKPLSFDYALSSRLEGIALGESGSWFFLIDPNNYDLFDATKLTKLSELGQTIGVLMHSVSSTYGHATYQYGQLQRQFLIQEDRIIFDFGDASSIEQTVCDAEMFWEDRLFAYLKQLGVELFFEDVQIALYQKGASMFGQHW